MDHSKPEHSHHSPDQHQDHFPEFHHSSDRLERPERVAELNPTRTLQRLNFKGDDVLCDIGAGSGLFTLPAAQMTNQTVYALDINPVMLEAIRAKAAAADVQNIVLSLVKDDRLPIPDQSTDLALVVTVLHEIPEKTPFFSEIQRLLKPTGRLAIVEFHKKITPMGPPPVVRLSPEDVIALMQDQPFALADQFDLGPNLYCLVFNLLG